MARLGWLVAAARRREAAANRFGFHKWRTWFNRTGPSQRDRPIPENLQILSRDFHFRPPSLRTVYTSRLRLWRATWELGVDARRNPVSRLVTTIRTPGMIAFVWSATTPAMDTVLRGQGAYREEACDCNPMEIVRSHDSPTSRLLKRISRPVRPQNSNFSANWICRDGKVARMVPKAASVILASGNPKFVWFSTSKNSERNCNLISS